MIPTAKNDLGEILKKGDKVRRLDNYGGARVGTVWTVNHDRGGRTPVLVRWSGVDYEWMGPSILIHATEEEA
jgi:hypothetical protein